LAVTGYADKILTSREYGLRLVYAAVMFLTAVLVIFLIITPLPDPTKLGPLGIIAVAAAIVAVAGVYTVGRWMASKNPSTLYLGVYFMTASITYVIVALSQSNLLPGDQVLNDYIALSLSVLGLILFSVSAFRALDWRGSFLVPVIVAVPALLLFLFSYPTPYREVTTLVPVLIITGLIQTLIPLGLFFILWWRMTKARAPGRSRALFLAIGTIVQLLATGGGSVVILSSAILLLISHSAWLLAVTGNADKLLKTTGE
jgi:hypothetical protein